MLTAIHPKLPLLKGDQAAQIQSLAKQWGADLKRQMGTYPAQMATSSGYRRTGTYGRMSRVTYELSGGHFAVVFSNPVIYGQYVGGPARPSLSNPIAQSREMARRNWPRVDEVAEDLWAKTETNIKRVISEAVN